ncbi:MAG: protein-tyrosine-phosphatase [Cytophagales bacterium]|uniref:protein-tyrosine-phosphatase n=1 Tax=Cyclobacterium marinum TaxID=104 RepID=UPI0030D86511|nr:protein-tyrosine-phosphatase [Cytophagales bacterium]|tara:strand:- start:56445 stop:57224 length:780 start_codon:yes stop_codon:yes gene_type:complete
MKKTILSISIAMALLSSCSQGNKDQAANDPINEVNDVAEVKTENTSKPKGEGITMYPELSKYIETVKAGMEAIPQDRKNQLKKIALFVKTKKQSNEDANLTFICTHNSRRSHMSQIWASTAANYYNIAYGINTFSGGTEATAFNPRAVAAMQRAGFAVENPGGDNPHYKVTFATEGAELECFSKKYDDPTNINENFVAVMTCSEADKNCPFIPGATLRVPIPYEDPKIADNTDQEASKYDERCLQIATEMFYLMSQVKV